MNTVDIQLGHLYIRTNIRTPFDTLCIASLLQKWDNSKN